MNRSTTTPSLEHGEFLAPFFQKMVAMELFSKGVARAPADPAAAIATNDEPPVAGR